MSESNSETDIIINRFKRRRKINKHFKLRYIVILFSIIISSLSFVLSKYITDTILLLVISSLSLLNSIFIILDIYYENKCKKNNILPN